MLSVVSSLSVLLALKSCFGLLIDTQIAKYFLMIDSQWREGHLHTKANVELNECCFVSLILASLSTLYVCVFPGVSDDSHLQKALNNS